MSSTVAHILHLEDSELDAELVRERLQQSGLSLEIELVSRRKDFIARLQSKPYDLILSDYYVPTFEGLAALDLAREHQPNTPFIFISGAMGEEFAVETLKRGATDYILKQRLTRLPAAVERALAEALERTQRRKAEERASVILESMTEMFIALDTEWRFFYVNAACERVLGKRRDELLGKSIWTEYPALADTPLESEARRVLREQVTAELEQHYAPCDKWFDVKAYPAEGGGLCLQARDVTAAKRTAEDLQVTEQRLKFALKAGRMGTWDLNLESMDLVCSDQCKANYGRGPAEPFTYSDLRKAILPEDEQHWLQIVNDAIARSADFDVEYRARWPNGEIRWLHVRGSCSADASGKVIDVSGISFDITERKQVEQDLARLLADEKNHTALLERVAHASRSMNAVLSAASIARIVTEESRTILNARTCATSFTKPEDGTQEIHAIASAGADGNPAHPDTALAFDAELAAEVGRNNTPGRRTDDKPESGRLLRLAVPLIGHGGKNLGVIQLAKKDDQDFSSGDEAVVMQLAAIAAVGIENARLYELLREQDKRKDEFLATLAHELRNPLAPVRNGLQILKIAGNSEAGHKTREMMERQIGHMVRLIDDLMDVSRITRGRVELRKERVGLRSVIDSALEASRPHIDKAGHALTVRVPSELTLHADPTRIAQVIANLLNNAAKYTPEGGHITLTAERDGHHVLIRVSDTGVGIPTEMLPRVFDMFTQVGRTLERSQGGLGIGLTLVRRLVEMHGGTVEVESPGPEQGTTFTVRLPLSGNEAPVRLAHADLNPASQGTLRILVVDDNVDGAESLAMLLGISGHLVKTAHTGPDAIVAVRGFKPEVLFLDIGLSEMDGYEVAERLHEEYGAACPILVALTGWGSDEDRRRSKQAGFDHHLTKPVDAAHIQRLLGDLIALFRSRRQARPVEVGAH